MTPEIDRPITILLVEDNPGDARLAAEAFKECDYKNDLHWAADGAQALDFLRQAARGPEPARPDLILLDLNLPGKNGREILAELKRDPRLKAIPVVVLTASDDETDRQECYDLLASCYITKPRRWDDFTTMIRTIGEIWLAQSAPARPAVTVREEGP